MTARTVLPQAGREALARLQMLAEQALEQVRAVSHSLHPPEWQDLTTAEALRNLVESSGFVGRLEVRLKSAAARGAVARRQNRDLPLRAGVHFQYRAAFRRHSFFACL